MSYSQNIPMLPAAVLLALLLPGPAEAQTCSCAGAPLISSQSISTTSNGNLLLGITHQFNDISLLYSGDSRLENQSVRRHTRSTLLEFSYGLTRRLTLTGTASFVNKYRETGLNRPTPPQTLTTRGVGDGLLMLKYVLHQNTIREQYQLALGGGVKMPIGRHTIRDGRVPLNADMQPGTGAWDGVLWSYFSKSFAPAATVNFFWFNTFRRTGTADRFGEDDRYRFGNEWVSTAGVTDKLAGDLSYVLMAQYRSTASDRRNGQALPNTGGKWISLSPGLTYPVAERFTLQVSGQVPVYQYLNGTQPTTAFTLSASLFFNLNRSVIF